MWFTSTHKHNDRKHQSITKEKGMVSKTFINNTRQLIEEHLVPGQYPSQRRQSPRSYKRPKTILHKPCKDIFHARQPPINKLIQTIHHSPVSYKQSLINPKSITPHHSHSHRPLPIQTRYLNLAKLTAHPTATSTHPRRRAPPTHSAPATHTARRRTSPLPARSPLELALRD